MARKKRKGTKSVVVGIVIAAVIWFLRDQGILEQEGGGLSAPGVAGGALPMASVSPDVFSPVRREGGDWERLTNCRLIRGRNSDGDSFHIRHEKGENEFRIYFVDAPESGYRTYGGGRDNGARLAEQGVAMGGLTQEETTRVGTAAKQLVKSLIETDGVEILTKWEEVFGPQRHYCLAIVKWEGREVYLHELLVTQGLGRIKTRGATLPQGRHYRAQKSYLSELERAARNQKAGAWSL